MRRSFWFAAMALFVLAGMALATVGKEPIRNLPVRGGSTDPAITVSSAPDHGPVVRPSLDLIGTTYDGGTTFYDYQHNGSSGKMISVDDLGYVHIVWMNGLTDVLAGPRHAYYNVWDPSTAAFAFQGGQQVNTSNRAGYACQAALSSGWCFPTFHQVVPGDANAHTAVAEDFLPTVAAFTTTMPAWLYEGGSSIEIIWPHACIGPDSAIHVASCENPASGIAGDPQRVYYSRGHPTWDTDGYGIQIEWDAVSGSDQFKYIDSVMVIAPVVAASPVSDRVAFVWVDSRDTLTNNPNQYNNDLYVMFSEDGGHNWGPPINVTDFIYPDWDCPSQDTLVCDKDTNRVYEDCNAIFDHNDFLHIAFTTSYYYTLEGTINVWFSDIWHWGEQFEEYTPICHGGFDSTTWTQAPGAWQREVQRPNLCEDPVTGYLYCSYQRYDSLHVSESGWPQGDAFVSVSCNGGRSWSVATNVTETGDVEGAPAGQCMSERDITLSEYVTYVSGEGYLHMQYVLDLDAGGIPQEEGIATQNPVKYQRIPISQIPLSPINDPYFPLLHIDSTGMPGRISPFDPNLCWGATEDVGALRPETFRLYQNYPNPFNPTTNIQFDLVRDARVTLKVYNVLGETVATLLDGRMVTAGAQTVRFDGSSLASGVYLYRLDVEGVSTSLKMVLMK